MKKLILIMILITPLTLLADYGGVHIEFTILLNDGNSERGYKYIPHGIKDNDFKERLENNPEVLLKNEYDFETGDFGFYEKRLSYSYNNSVVYLLIEPKEIKISTITSVSITDMIESPYYIQIGSNHSWKDRNWMKTKPRFKYSEGEGMCSYEIFIHATTDIPEEELEKIDEIITNSKIEIEQKIKDNTIESDEEYDNLMQEIWERRKRLLKPFFEKHDGLKTVIISSCTC